MRKMEQNTNLAEKMGLAKRTKLIQINANTIGILKKRKSRIIMKDGKQVLEIAKQIRKYDKKNNVVLIIQGPICSKTINFLSENSIGIIEESH